VSFDHTFTQLATTDGESLHIREITAGRLVGHLKAHGSYVTPQASYDGKLILLADARGRWGDETRRSNELVTWSIDGFAPSYQHVERKEGFKIVDVSLETNLALASNDKGDFIVYSTSSGEETAKRKREPKTLNGKSYNGCSTY